MATMALSVNKLRTLARVDSTSMDDTAAFVLLNEVWLELLREVARNRIEVTGIVAYTSLVQDQEDYSIPDDCFEIVHMEINYDDPTDYTKWIKVTPADLPNIPVVWQQLVRSHPKSQAVWDTFGGQFYVAPRPGAAAANGLRLWYIQKKADFSATTDTIPWPFGFYHDLLALGAAVQYWLPYNADEASKYLGLYEKKLADMIDNLKDEVSEPIKSGTIDRTNFGWDG